MPQSDTALPALASVWAELSRGRASVTVAARKLSDADPDPVPDLGALPIGTRVSALCWAISTPPPLSALRVVMGPEAVLAVLIVPPRSGFSRFLSFRPQEPAPLEGLCTELLLRGFIEPTCTRCAEGAVLVHASLPARPHWLDAFFEQPLTPPSR